jgi:hypothetical protein
VQREKGGCSGEPLTRLAIGIGLLATKLNPGVVPIAQVSPSSSLFISFGHLKHRVNDEQLVKGQTAMCSSGIVVPSDTALAPWRVRLPVSASTRCLETAGSMRSGSQIYQTTSEASVDDTTTSRSLVLISFDSTRLDPKAVVDIARTGGDVPSLSALSDHLGRLPLRTTKPLQLRWMMSKITEKT